MDERLQQAIAAIKAHDNQTAQQLLAQFLKSNPNHPQGWFLLSQVVADKKQQIAFLNKTLELDPGNKLARQKLIQLGEPLPESDGLQVAEAALPVSEGHRAFEEQAQADTVPSWMAGHKTHQVDEPAEVQSDMIMSEEDEVAVPMPQPEDIPDWLKEEPVGEWAEKEATPEDESSAHEKETVVSEPTELKKNAAATTATKKIVDKGMEPLPWYFWALAIFALLIFVAILYQVVTLF